MRQHVFHLHRSISVRGVFYSSCCRSVPGGHRWKCIWICASFISCIKSCKLRSIVIHHRLSRRLVSLVWLRRRWHWLVRLSPSASSASIAAPSAAQTTYTRCAETNTTAQAGEDTPKNRKDNERANNDCCDNRPPRTVSHVRLILLEANILAICLAHARVP